MTRDEAQARQAMLRSLRDRTAAWQAEQAGRHEDAARLHRTADAFGIFHELTAEKQDALKAARKRLADFTKGS